MKYWLFQDPFMFASIWSRTLCISPLNSATLLIFHCANIFMTRQNPLRFCLFIYKPNRYKDELHETKETTIPKEIYPWHPDSRQIYRTPSSFRWQLQIERCNVTILTCLFLSVSIFKLCWYIYILWSCNK